MPIELSRFGIDPRAGIGIAAQIRARAAILIADGVLAPGDLLPSVRSLARALDTNVNTVRAAYARLEVDGLVRTRHGVGTVVVRGPEAQAQVGATPLGANAVAVLVAGLDPFYLDVVRGIEQEADPDGVLVVVADAEESDERAAHMVRRLAARGLDGIIALSVNVGPVIDGEADVGDRPPIVHVDAPDALGPSFVFDAEAGAHAATRHLVEHGHRAIALITPARDWPTVRGLVDGHARALREAGIPRGPLPVVETGEFSVEAGAAGIARALDGPQPPTAALVASEALALGVLREARVRGLATPGDLAVVGYAETAIAQTLDPALTMIGVPAVQAGRDAMRTLAALVRGDARQPGRVVLPVELRIRQSCGAHPGSR